MRPAWPPCVPGTWLVNASRGAVVDNQALRRLLEGGADLEVALDVWEGEPQADPELAARCLIATPHIAGYSLEGKLRGTAQIYQAYCAWRGIAERVSLQDVLPETWLAGLQLNPGCDPAWALATLCRAVYDPRSDDAAFRRSLTGDSATRRAAFDALRNTTRRAARSPACASPLVDGRSCSGWCGRWGAQLV
ncbi:DUF3410 domain-containing protein [Pseudomonas aeruginosa]|nr:DUF3410 domain-containing protein [Pseudomonas aeruginosa]